MREALNTNETTRFLRSLRAVRRFAETPIADAILLDILEVARWTGSSKNDQPWEFVVVRERATLAELATCGRYGGHLAGARAAIALVIDAAVPGAEFDQGRVAQNIMLAAWAHGVGSCIASLYPEENTRRAKALLGVPAHLVLETAISLGYPADEAALRLSRAPEAARDAPIGRKPLDALVSWERYGRRRA